MRYSQLAFVAVALLLGACSSEAPPPAAPPLSYIKSAPFSMDVANVNIVESYKTSSQVPHVEGVFTPTPAAGIRQWVTDRVRAVGAKRVLSVTIKDASVVESEVPSSDPGSYFHEGGRRYDGRVEVEMRIYSESSAMSDASINVVATRSDTLADHASLSTRKALFTRMNRELMEVMNGELEKNFYRYFSNYIRYD